MTTPTKPRPRPRRKTSAGRFSTTVRWSVAAFVVVALAAIAFQAHFNSPERLCLALLPAETKAGVTVAEGRETSKIDITSSTASRGAQSNLQRSGFIECLGLVRGATTVDRNQTAFGLSTLGQLVDQWSGDVGAFRVVMRNPDRVLDNFIIGPDEGHKADVMERWCASNAACVTCAPNAAQPDATSVSVTLKERAPVHREVMPSRSDWAATSNRPSYIEVIDGKRVGWSCKAT